MSLISRILNYVGSRVRRRRRRDASESGDIREESPERRSPAPVTRRSEWLEMRRRIRRAMKERSNHSNASSDISQEIAPTTSPERSGRTSDFPEASSDTSQETTPITSSERSGRTSDLPEASSDTAQETTPITSSENPRETSDPPEASTPAPEASVQPENGNLGNRDHGSSTNHQEASSTSATAQLAPIVDSTDGTGEDPALAPRTTMAARDGVQDPPSLITSTATDVILLQLNSPPGPPDWNTEPWGERTFNQDLIRKSDITWLTKKIIELRIEHYETKKDVFYGKEHKNLMESDYYQIQEILMNRITYDTNDPNVTKRVKKFVRQRIRESKDVVIKQAYKTLLKNYHNCLNREFFFLTTCEDFQFFAQLEYGLLLDKQPFWY